MKDGNSKLSLTSLNVPVIGEVFAGRAVPLDALPIIGWRVIRPVRGSRLGDRYAAPPVNGDSMLGEHICHGDIVIFCVTNEAQAGDLVIALTPDGLTLKRVYPQEDGRLLLRAASRQYDQVWESKLVKIQGVVKRVERDF